MHEIRKARKKKKHCFNFCAIWIIIGSVVVKRDIF